MTPQERTLILVKPDGLKRGLVGDIIKRFESRGLKLVAMKMIKPTKAHVEKHYLPTTAQLTGMGGKTLENLAVHNINPITQFGTKDALKIGKMINSWNVEFLTSAPNIAMVFQGLHAVEIGRKIVGNTLPSKAEVGTIRGDYAVDSPVFANVKMRSVRNVVHASGTVPEANREIKHWFSKKEIHDYKRVDEDLLFS